MTELDTNPSRSSRVGRLLPLTRWYGQLAALPDRLWARTGLFRTPRLGEVLVKSQLITASQLKKALERQQTDRQPLGRLVVAAGYATEEEVLASIIKYYHISAQSLSDDIRELIQSRWDLRKKLIKLRALFRLKLSLASAFVIWLTVLVLSLVVLNREKTQLYHQAVRLGVVSISLAAEQAREPLLKGNTLQLNRLIKTTASTEGALYGYIVDRKGVIRAHSNPKLIGTTLPPRKQKIPESRQGRVFYHTVREADGTKTLHLSEPLTFHATPLGTIHLALSLGFIQQQIHEETLYIILLSGLIVLLGVALAIYLGGSFLRPVADLVTGAQKTLANQQYRVMIRRDHEFEDLTTSFSFIARELRNKLMMEQALGRIVSPELLEMIKTKPEESWLKGTRNQATILFTDVRGFTALSETREPEEIVAALNEYFAIASKAILENGGYVDKFVGDAVLGVFGVPAAHADHASRAVRAAVTMQKALKRKARLNTNPFLEKVGIGINTGVVVAGNIGSEDKLEYTVIGDSVNVASRLNGLAGPGEIIISRSVYEKIERHLVTVSELSPQTVKGKSAPIEVLKVLRTEF